MQNRQKIKKRERKEEGRWAFGREIKGGDLIFVEQPLLPHISTQFTHPFLPSHLLSISTSSTLTTAPSPLSTHYNTTTQLLLHSPLHRIFLYSRNSSPLTLHFHEPPPTTPSPLSSPSQLPISTTTNNIIFALSPPTTPSPLPLHSQLPISTTSINHQEPPSPLTPTTPSPKTTYKHPSIGYSTTTTPTPSPLTITPPSPFHDRESSRTTIVSHHCTSPLRPPYSSRSHFPSTLLLPSSLLASLHCIPYPFHVFHFRSSNSHSRFFHFENKSLHSFCLCLC